MADRLSRYFDKVPFRGKTGVKEIEKAHFAKRKTAMNLSIHRCFVWQALTKKIFLSDAYSSGVEIKNHEHQIEVMISDKDILVNGWPY